MSTERSPEQIAEERYPNDAENQLYGLPSPYCSGQRQGYAACYREHVLNRHPVTVEGIMGEATKAYNDHYTEFFHGGPERVTDFSEFAKSRRDFEHRLRSRLESYLTPNTKP